MIYQVPFAYERYGRLEIEAPENASRKEVIELAEQKLERLSLQVMDEMTTYLEDSEEIDYDGIIMDEKNNEVDFDALEK